jgi:hypothetical protein
MKKFSILLSLIVTFQLGFGQISAIKKNLKELYFEISIPTTKYDLRKLLNSNENFKNINEHTINKRESISVNFNKNNKLSYTGNSVERQFDFWFYKESDINYCAVLSLYYLPENLVECTKQYNELIGFFKGISFKTKKAPDMLNGNKIGELNYYYSSLKSEQSNNAYLIIDVGEVDFGQGRKYALNVKYYIKSLY